MYRHWTKTPLKLEKLLDDQGKPVGWQLPQQMSLLDIDTNGLSTSGGVLKFAYTEADQAVAEDYSDAAEASFPMSLTIP